MGTAATLRGVVPIHTRAISTGGGHSHNKQKRAEREGQLKDHPPKSRGEFFPRFFPRFSHEKSRSETHGLRPAKVLVAGKGVEPLTRGRESNP